MKKVLLIVAALSALSVCTFAQCASFPCVVATASLTNQTHGINRTILFTPTVEGTFRVSAYMGTSTVGSNVAQFELFIHWADGLRARRSMNLGTARASTNASSATVVVHDIAGQPLEYRTDLILGTSGGMKYDLYIVVEQLQ